MKFFKNILLFLFIICCISAANAKNPILHGEAVNVEIIKILNEAEVYPNPAEDFIYLKINDSSISPDITIQVMSIIGTKMNISHEKVDTGLYKINLKNIPVGHYYIMLTIDTEKSLKKFLKK